MLLQGSKLIVQILSKIQPNQLDTLHREGVPAVECAQGQKSPLSMNIRRFFSHA